MAIINFTTIDSPQALKRYFAAALSTGDYYKSAHAPSFWAGKLAHEFGLEGEVRKEHFHRLAEGLHPFLDERLTQRQKANRRVAVDITLSFNKDVSLAWAFGSDEERRSLEATFERLGRHLAERMEKDAATRVRSGGRDETRKTGNLVVAVFIHFEARPVDGKPDPQVHLHIIVFNVTHDPIEQRRKALDIASLRENAPSYEAFVDSLCASELRDMGYQVEPSENEKTFRITGITDEMRTKFSRRTTQIEAEAVRRGISDPKQKATLGAKTRSKKGAPLTSDELRTLWQSKLTADELEIVSHLKAPLRVAIPEKENGSRDLDNTSVAHGKVQEEAAGIDSKRVAAPEEDRERPSPHDQDAGINRRTSRDNSRDTGRPEPRGSGRSQESSSHDFNQGAHRSNDSPKSARVEANPIKPSRSARNILDRAAGELFDRNAVIRESDLITRAFNLSAGRCMSSELEAALRGHKGLLRRRIENVPYITTPAVLREEKAVVDAVRAARGTHPPLSPRTFNPKGSHLLENERSAIRQLLSSRNGIDLFVCSSSHRERLLQELRSAVQSAGRHFTLFAPSAIVANVALKEEGFKNAKTVAQLLSNDSIQSKIGREHVVAVDQAGTIGTRTLRELLALQQKRHFRLILVGDPKHTKSIERGSIFKLLEEEGGLKPATITHLAKSGDQLGRARELLARHRTAAAVDVLREAGSIFECENEASAHERLARVYVSHSKMKKRPIVVVASHKEGDAITTMIRNTLRERKLLGRNRKFLQLKPLYPTAPEKADPAFYKRRMVVQFHKNGKHLLETFRAGERWTVRARDPFGNVIISKGAVMRALPLALADRFQVYEKKVTTLARGDVVRFTANGKSENRSIFRNRPFRIANGSVYKIAGFTPLGNIRLTSGVIVPRKFGHLTHAYCSTTNAVQRQSSPLVLTAITRSSFPKLNVQQVYTAIQAAKGDLRIFTDDAANLKKAFGKEKPSYTATELFRDHDLGNRLARRHLMKECVNIAARAARECRERVARTMAMPRQDRSRDREAHM